MTDKVTFRDLIGRWRSIGGFASDIEESANLASKMKSRNRVSSKYWKRMQAGAERRGHPVSDAELARAEMAFRELQTQPELELAGGSES